MNWKDKEPPHCPTCCCRTGEGAVIARLRAERDQYFNEAMQNEAEANDLRAEVAARDRVIEAAFKALDDAVAGIRYVEQKEHFYGLGADRVEEKYAEARRLRAELEGK